MTDLAPADSEGPNPATTSPRLRGVSHQVAFFVSLALGPILVIGANTTTARVATTVYAAALAALFGCRALLHRGRWSPTTEPWMRRLDHSTIFVFIAGTYTPVVALSLPTTSATRIIVAVWAGAAIGVGVTMFWIDATLGDDRVLYLVVGWIAVVVFPELWSTLGAAKFSLLAFGGLLYSVGAIVYARKHPDPWPDVFGYHEVFHALVISAVLCHYVVITALSRG